MLRAGGPAAGELGSATRNLAAALARNLLYQQQQQQQQDDAATKGLCAPSSTAHASVSPAADAIRVSADRQCDSATAQHGAQVPHAAAAIAVAATVVPQSVSTSSSTLKDGSLTISTSHRLGPKEDPPACTCDVPLTSASAPGAGTPRASFPTAQPDAGTSASWGASGSVRSGGPGVSAAAAVGEGVGPAFFGPGFGMMPGMSGIMQQAQRALSQLSALSTQAADMQHALGALPQVVSRLEALESVWSAELGALRSTAESLQASHERVEERLALLEGRLADAGAR